MTGPEHYAEAERLLNGDPLDQAAAQVHATLALAAATALGVADGPTVPETNAASKWRKAIL